MQFEDLTPRQVVNIYDEMTKDGFRFVFDISDMTEGMLREMVNTYNRMNNV